MDKNGEKSVNFGSGVSPDLGLLAERELLNWIEDLCMMEKLLSGAKFKRLLLALQEHKVTPSPPFFCSFFFFFCSSYS